MSHLDAASIAAVFDLGDESRLGEVVARGEQGHIRRLDTDRGSFAVKETFEGVDNADAEDSAAFQARCHAAGVPCPRPYADRSGRFLVDLGGTAVRVLGWVDLVDPDPLLEPALVGRAVAALHAVVTPTTGEARAWHTELVGRAEWRGLVKAAKGAGAPFADRLDDLVPGLLEAERLLTPMRPVQVLHLDLWADNLRSEPDGTPCVIDFDNAGPGDPDRELAMVLFEFGQGQGARVRELAAAYAEAGGSGRVTGPGDFAMTIAQLHHIGHYQVQNWLAARDPEGRARAHAAVREFVDQPFLVADVERVLDELRV